MDCPNCFKTNDKNAIKCDCGYQFEGYKPDMKPDMSPEKNPEKNHFEGYPTLGFLSQFYNFLAYASIFIALIYGLFMASSLPNDGTGFGLVIVSALFIGLVGYLSFKLFAESIKLFVNIAKDVNVIKNKMK